MLLSDSQSPLLRSAECLAQSLDEIAEDLLAKRPVSVQSDAEEHLAQQLEQLPEELDDAQRLVQTQLALICRQLGSLRTLAAHLVKEPAGNAG